MNFANLTQKYGFEAKEPCILGFLLLLVGILFMFIALIKNDTELNKTTWGHLVKPLLFLSLIIATYDLITKFS